MSELSPLRTRTLKAPQHPVAAVPVGKMLFEGHAVAGTTLGELADALVFFPPGAPNLQPTSVDPVFEQELERRWKLLRQARSRSSAANRRPQD